MLGIVTTAMTEVGTVPTWTLGWRLQRSLAHAELSVAEMADELGVTRSTISRWMHDKGAPPRTIYVRQWAMRTGVSADWLNGSAGPANEVSTSQYPGVSATVIPLHPQVRRMPRTALTAPLRRTGEDSRVAS